MSYDSKGKLVCDMVEGCAAAVTHLDRKGYVYCTPHGEQRQSTQPCRKLRPHEVKRLNQGEPIERY